MATKIVVSTRPEEAHHVKKGAYFLLKGNPCRIMEVKTSKTGKHGHAKCNITGIDVLTGRKYNEVHPGHIVLEAFDRRQEEYDVSYTEGDPPNMVVHCMDAEGNTEVFENYFEESLQTDISKKCNPETDDGKMWKVCVAYAPSGEGESQKTLSTIVEIKEDKEV